MSEMTNREWLEGLSDEELAKTIVEMASRGMPPEKLYSELLGWLSSTRLG